MLPFLGPAVMASIAYMDPGNFATNIQAGAQFGYRLVWVVVLANLVAMMFQALSARIGIVTNQSLAQLCRAHFPRPLVYVMWAVSEIAAMATDLAESLGAAIGLSLLFGLPLLVSLLVTCAATYAMLMLQRRGFRPIELLIAGFVGVISLCYLIELAVSPPDWPALLRGAVIPTLAGPDSVTLAVGIIGATVMPHAIYLHSGLTQGRVRARNDAERRVLLRYSNREVVLALTLAGAVNAAMVMMAAAAFHAGHPEVAEIETAYHSLAPLLGGAAAGLFLISLMASGISSSVVGTMAGQVIMQGFLRRRIPVWARRLVTMLPAFAVVAAGADATHCLVISQVILSLVLPVPMVALLLLSRRPALMGGFVAGPVMSGLAALSAVVTVALNGMLLVQMVG
jgi:manganese transport protein